MSYCPLLKPDSFTILLPSVQPALNRHGGKNVLSLALDRGWGGGGSLCRRHAGGSSIPSLSVLALLAREIDYDGEARFTLNVSSKRRKKVTSKVETSAY